MGAILTEGYDGVVICETFRQIPLAVLYFLPAPSYLTRKGVLNMNSATNQTTSQTETTKEKVN